MLGFYTNDVAAKTEANTVLMLAENVSLIKLIVLDNNPRILLPCPNLFVVAILGTAFPICGNTSSAKRAPTRPPDKVLDDQVQ